MITPEQGAATSVLLAASPLLEGVGGRYFEDCQEAEPGSRVAPYALDPENAERLWDVSARSLASWGAWPPTSSTRPASSGRAS